MGVLLFNRIRTMLLTASLLFLSEVIRLLYAEKEMALLGQTGSTSLPNKIVRHYQLMRLYFIFLTLEGKLLILSRPKKLLEQSLKYQEEYLKIYLLCQPIQRLNFTKQTPQMVMHLQYRKIKKAVLLLLTLILL